MIGAQQKIKQQVDAVLSELLNLIPEIVEDVIVSDERAISANKPWYERHRLGVLIESAKKARNLIDQNILYSPWFLSELGVYNGLIRKWKGEEIWTSIMNSLKDPNHFRHTMLKLLIAHHLEKQEYEVKIVPREINRSPDLMYKTKDEKALWLYIECYQPYILSGIMQNISKDGIKIVSKRLMDKAKKQFNEHYPGVMALCCYYMTRNSMDKIRNFLVERLGKTKRRYFGGVMLVNFYVEMLQTKDSRSFPSKYYIDFVYNPSYFGKIGIEEGSRHLKKEEKQITLPLINKNQIQYRAVIKTKSENTLPFFEGTGNITYRCGRCKSILIENVWDLSLNNLIFYCPVCNSYNEITGFDHNKYGDLISRIAMMEGVYHTSGCATLIVGTMLIGARKEN